MPESSDFRALLESAPDAIVLAGADGTIELVNRRTEELFGYDRTEVRGAPVELLVPERFRSTHVDHRAAYVLDPRTREMGLDLDLYGRRKDGSEFPVEISLSPLYERGRLRVITVIRDVSERRAAETGFRALLESAPDAIVLVGTDGRISLVNRRAEELFGYEPGTLLGRDVEVLVPGRFHAVHVEHRARYAADPRTREMGVGLELYGRRKDGSEFPVEISLSPTHSSGQEHVITIIRDVSERRAAEQERIALAREQAGHAEAEAARERLASILGDIDAIIWESDADVSAFSFVSGRAEELLGYPRERWLGEPHFWRTLVHPDDLDLAVLSLREAIATKDHHELEYRVHAADGRVVTVRDRIRITRTPSGEIRLRGVMVDLTARLELEERLLQSQKMEAVGQLAGGVAHDFNNLITVITGYVNLVSARIEDETVRSHLAEITRAAGRAADLTSQLLAFSRRAPSHTELIELDELLRGVEPMLRRLIDEDIALTVETGGSGPVEADRGQLEQVVVNLVVNARDAMPAGGEIRVRTGAVELDTTSAAEHGIRATRYATLMVADTGSGMTAETQARMFEPFFTTKAQGKGTGLGLATVFGIVEQAGGTIVVDSELGAGTTLTVLLPASTPVDVPAGEGEGDETTVLVVEDETALRTLARIVLEGQGYRVFDVGNGREAIRFLERHRGRLDLVLTDVVMPDVNGPELVARLEQLRPETRVLYMSGYADSRLVNRGIAEGRVNILRKPFETEDLATRVAEILSVGARAD